MSELPSQPVSPTEFFEHYLPRAFEDLVLPDDVSDLELAFDAGALLVLGHGPAVVGAVSPAASFLRGPRRVGGRAGALRAAAVRCG